MGGANGRLVARSRSGPGLAVLVGAVLATSCGPKAAHVHGAGSGGETGGTSTTPGGAVSTTTGTSGGQADTGAGTTSTSTSSSAEAGGGCSFIYYCLPDGGGADIECSIWEQDCKRGQKCMPWANDGGNSWNATKCTPLDPMPSVPGQSCTVQGSGVSGVDDCEVGSICWNVDPATESGVCMPFCAGSQANAECDDPQATCLVANDGVLTLCLPQCNPLAQDCPTGQVCAPAQGAFVCLPDAWPGPMGAAGDPCEYTNVCDSGLMCVRAAGVPGCTGSTACCSPYCDLSDPSASAACPGADAGQACVPVFGSDPPSAGYEQVGVCSAIRDPVPSDWVVMPQ